MRGGWAGLAASWALLVCRLGVTHRAIAATTIRIATPVAPHLNFFTRAMARFYQKSLRSARYGSERCREGQITPGEAYDRERPIDRRQDLVVLIERRVCDINYVKSLQTQ